MKAKYIAAGNYYELIIRKGPLLILFPNGNLWCASCESPMPLLKDEIGEHLKAEHKVDYKLRVDYIHAIMLTCNLDGIILKGQCFDSEIFDPVSLEKPIGELFTEG